MDIAAKKRVGQSLSKAGLNIASQRHLRDNSVPQLSVKNSAQNINIKELMINKESDYAQTSNSRFRNFDAGGPGPFADSKIPMVRRSGLKPHAALINQRSGEYD